MVRSKEKLILPKGTLIEVGSNGFLSKITPNIVSPWKEAVADVKTEYLRNLRNTLHSVYIRGSVAQGTAIKDVSDIDSFAVIKGDVNKLETDWVDVVEDVIKKRYPFVTKVEFGFLPYNELTKSEEYFPSRFTIKVTSVCIYGEDLSKLIRGVKPDIETAQKLQEDIKWVIEVTKRDMKNKNNQTVKNRCSWAMKRLLRQGMIIVMPREKAFSRDLYICYKTFSKYYPERERDMLKVLELAIYPTHNKKTIEIVIDGHFTEWLIKESERVLK
jgi:hypothetical protein